MPPPMMRSLPSGWLYLHCEAEQGLGEGEGLSVEGAPEYLLCWPACGFGRSPPHQGGEGDRHAWEARREGNGLRVAAKHLCR
eukprot:816304-Heterocapsa_arctica.AAC.1